MQKHFLDDDNKLYQKYLNKKVNAKKEGVECNLTFEEYCSLLEKAGLKSSDLGFTGKGYVLARINDEGNYTYESCRFITQKENARERKISDKSRIASRNNIVRFNNNVVRNDEWKQKITNGIHNSDYYKQKHAESLVRQENNKDKNKPHSGSRNSHFGTFWITNGEKNKVWKNEYGELPKGFYKGRYMGLNKKRGVG